MWYIFFWTTQLRLKHSLKRRCIQPETCNLSKNWICLSVIKTAKSDRPCIGRTMIFFSVFAQRVTSLVWLYGRLYKRLNYMARFWILAIVSNVSLISTETHLKRYLNWLSATTSRRSYDFFSQHGFACAKAVAVISVQTPAAQLVYICTQDLLYVILKEALDNQNCVFLLRLISI